MKLIDKEKQAAMEGAVTKALEYLEKDPEENRDFGREPGYEEQMAYFRRRREEIGF